MEKVPLNIESELVQCAVCLEELSDPRALPCLHRFCRKCIGNLIKDKSVTFPCPMCRKEIEIPESRERGFPRDFLTFTLLEKLRFKKGIAKKDLKDTCGCCEELKMCIAHCMTCESFICKECYDFHGKRGMQDHEGVIKLGNMNSEESFQAFEIASRSVKPPKCSRHRDYGMHLLCIDCGDELLCATCSIVLHRNHKVMEVLERSESLMKEISHGWQEMVPKETKWREYLKETMSMQEKIHATRKTLDSRVKTLWTKKKQGIEESLGQEMNAIETDSARDVNELREKIKELENKIKLREEKCSLELKLAKRKADEDLKELMKSKETTLKLISEAEKQFEEHFRIPQELTESVLERCKNINKSISAAKLEQSHWKLVKTAPPIKKAILDLSEEMDERVPVITSLRNENIAFIDSDLPKKIGDILSVPYVCSIHQALKSFYCKICEKEICVICKEKTCKQHQSDVTTVKQISEDVQKEDLSEIIKIERKVLQIKFRIDKGNHLFYHDSCDTASRGASHGHESNGDMQVKLKEREKSVSEINGKIKKLLQQLSDLKAMIGVKCRNVSELKKNKENINSGKNEVKMTLDRIKDKVKENHLGHPFYQEPGKYPSFQKICQNRIIGLNLYQECIVQVFDMRDQGGHIEVRSVDCSNPQKRYFTHNIPCTGDDMDQSVPVVMSPIDYWFNNGYKLLLGVGSTVHIVYMRWNNGLYDSVTKVSSHVLDAPYDSYISALHAHASNNSRKYEFIAAFSTSTIVHRFNAQCELLGKVDCGDRVKCISGIACHDDVMAVIDPTCNDVIILRDLEDGDVVEVRKLDCPDTCEGVFPKCVLWTGAYWMVLWYWWKPQIPCEHHWLLTYHDKNLTLLKRYHNSEKALSNPVCISRSGNDFIVCFTSTDYLIENYGKIPHV